MILTSILHLSSDLIGLLFVDFNLWLRGSLPLLGGGLRDNLDGNITNDGVLKNRNLYGLTSKGQRGSLFVDVYNDLIINISEVLKQL
jgi:hypothetical protein